MQKMRFIDLFCGIGGFRLGLEALGHRCVFSCDIDKYAREAYQKNFGDVPSEDILTIPADNIPEHDILTAGFPCQPFSTSGNKRGMADKRGMLIYEVLRIVEHHAPRVVILENVKNILSISGGMVLREIYKQFDSLGYSLRHALLNSGDYGIPQARERVYFIALRKDTNARWQFPVSPGENVVLADVLLSDTITAEMYKYTERRHFVIDRPERLGIRINKLLRVGYMKKYSDMHPHLFNQQGERLYSVDGLSACITASDSYTACTENYLLPSNIELGEWQGEATRKHNQNNSLFSMLGHAKTITANEKHAIYGAGIYLSTEHRVRPLHIDEIKLVMGFPQSHAVGDKVQGRKQLGNAVIPRMVSLVAEGIQ